MIGGGLSLALAPAPLALAALVLYGLPRGAARAARLVGVLACAVTLVLLAFDAVQISGPGRIEVSYGSPVTGVDLLLRADALGIDLAIAATAIVLLELVERVRAPLETGALVVSVLGAVLTALAGNAIVLFGGLEIANIGAALALSAGRRRPGRGTIAALAIEHAAALGVLAAAAQLQATQGTTDFTALPPAAIVTAVALPWAIGGAVRLLAPAVLPLRSAGGAASVLAAAAAVPCGAVALLRLREAAGGALPDAVELVLAGLGAAAALGGALAAIRWAATPAVAGRGLVVMTGGGVVAMSGFGTAPATAALAAGICALILAAALAPAWEQPAAAGPARWAGAAALAAAASTPLGFGAVALVLELAAALSLGRTAGTALAASLAAAGILAVVGGVRAAIAHVAEPAVPRHRAVPLVAGAALAATLGAALLPGAVVSGALAALGGGGGARAAGPAAVTGPAGGWAEGYFLPALLVAAVAMASLARIQGWPRPAAPSALRAGPARSRLIWPLALGAGRRVRRPIRAAARVLRAADAWLMVQPQLPLVLLGGLLAIVLIR